MSAIVTFGFGPGASIPLVALFGFVPGAATTEESDSTAGLRYYMALELPGMLGGVGQADVTADWTRIIGTVAELGETATLDGTDIDVIGVTPYLGAFPGAVEVEGRVTRMYATQGAFDDAAGELGSTVTFRSLTYTIGRIERMDGGLVRMELVR